MRIPYFLFLPTVLLCSCGGEAMVPVDTTTDAGIEADAPDLPDAPDAAVDRDAPDPVDVSSPDADAPDADAPDAPTWDQVTGCPEGMGPTMVLLPSGFCIDSTEVTRGQYEAWVATNPSLSNQHPRCSEWNDSLVSESWCEEHYTWNCSASDCPQPCIDWCDAYAFCQAAGKRLCGKHGGGDLTDWDTLDWGILRDPAYSQWYDACTSGGQSTYPYGAVYDENACNTGQVGGGTDPVAAHTSCQSPIPGYEGVYDLSGNLNEWEDACQPAVDDGETPQDGSQDNCIVRGGTFAASNDDAACATMDTSSRSSAIVTGIRCCYP